MEVLLINKEFFEQGIYLDLEIKTKHEEVEKLEKLIGTVNSEIKEVNEKINEDLICRIDGYKKELVKDITKLVYTKHQILLAINELSDSRSRVLMTLRYIEFKTWEEIADEMEYCIAQVKRIHSAILKSYDDCKSII